MLLPSIKPWGELQWIKLSRWISVRGATSGWEDKS